MKLEEIPKKQPFDVPDGYFDAFPQRLQKRIAEGKGEVSPSFVFRYKLQFVIPVVLLLVIGGTWLSRESTSQSPESLLASVETADLISYLNESDISTDELIREGYFTSDDADEIETQVYEVPMADEDIDLIIQQFETDSI